VGSNGSRTVGPKAQEETRKWFFVIESSKNAGGNGSRTVGPKAQEETREWFLIFELAGWQRFSNRWAEGQGGYAEIVFISESSKKRKNSPCLLRHSPPRFKNRGYPLYLLSNQRKTRSFALSLAACVALDQTAIPDHFLQFS
jgi:hypothetical protein